MQFKEYVHAMADELHSKDFRRLAIPSAVLVCVAVLFLFLGLQQSRTFFSGKPIVTFAEELGTNVCFAPAGNGLATAGEDCIRLYSVKGEIIGEQSVSYAAPLCAGSTSVSVFGSSGERGFDVIRSTGTVHHADTEGGLFFLDVNEGGMIAVLSEKRGYKGSVTVYGRDLTPLFRWDSATGYPVSARLTDTGTLVVQCVTETGSVLRFFRPDTEDEQGRYEHPGGLLIDFGVLSDGTVAALTVNSLLLLDKTGRFLAERELSSVPCSWSLDGDNAVIGTEDSTLSVITSAGDILASRRMEDKSLAISQKGGSVLVLFPGEATLFTEMLEADISYQNVDNVSSVFLRSDHIALLCGAERIERVDFDQ